MKKILLIVISLFLYKTTFANSDIIIEKDYHFIIGTVESIEKIEVPEKYLLSEKFKGLNIGNEIVLMKINDYKNFSSRKKTIKGDKNLYIYIAPIYRFKEEGKVNIGDRIIFGYRDKVQDDITFSPLYYSRSILDLFYDDNNDYAYYPHAIGIFGCKNNKYEIQNIGNYDESFFYGPLASVDINTKGLTIENISEFQKNIFLDALDKLSICKNQEKNNGNKKMIFNNNADVKKMEYDFIYYILGGIIALIGILYIYIKRKRK